MTTDSGHVGDHAFHSIWTHNKQDGSVAFDLSRYNLIREAVLNYCDDKAGLKDGLISDPRKCDFDPAMIPCGRRESDADCLCATEVQALRTIYFPVRDERGTILYPGADLGPESHWRDWVLPRDSVHAARSRRTFKGYLTDIEFVNAPPDYRWQDFDWDRDRDRLTHVSVFMDATNPRSVPLPRLQRQNDRRARLERRCHRRFGKHQVHEQVRSHERSRSGRCVRMPVPAALSGFSRESEAADAHGPRVRRFSHTLTTVQEPGIVSELPGSESFGLWSQQSILEERCHLIEDEQTRPASTAPVRRGGRHGRIHADPHGYAHARTRHHNGRSNGRRRDHRFLSDRGRRPRLDRADRDQPRAPFEAGRRVRGFSRAGRLTPDAMRHGRLFRPGTPVPITSDFETTGMAHEIP